MAKAVLPSWQRPQNLPARISSCEKPASAWGKVDGWLATLAPVLVALLGVALIAVGGIGLLRE